MSTNYISIKSVLYDLSHIIDERYWNENKMTEYALKALRQVSTSLLLQDKVQLVELEEHRAVLPCDFKYLNQIAYLQATSNATNAVIKALRLPHAWDIVEEYKNRWYPMRLSASTFHQSICVDQTINSCPNCQQEYSISPDLTITSTLKNGLLLVSYKAYVTNAEDEFLIPDNESLKEALTNACLYKY